MISYVFPPIAAEFPRYVSLVYLLFMQSISELEKEIRKRINTPWKQNALLQDTAVWEMICSCLDTIGDTELALDAYLEVEWPEEDGARYIIIYGVLQVLFVQQDAVANMADALDITYERDPLLKEIREVRNDSVGHPTKRGYGDGKKFNFISRPTLRKTGFKLMSTYPDDRPPTFEDVKIEDLIRTQRDKLKDFLTEVISKLEKEDMEHKDEFSDHLLQDLFPEMLRYHISKVGEAIYGSRPNEVSLVDLESLEKTIDKFEKRLAERGEAGAFSEIDRTIDLLKHALKRLRRYIEGHDGLGMTEQDAYIYFSFTSNRFEELKEFSREIDEPYQGSNKDT